MTLVNYYVGLNFSSLIITGVALLKEYQARYSEFEAQRGELTNAEKLFDLSITGYPHLVEVEKELKNSALVFELYEAQRVSPTSPWMKN